MKRDVLIIVVAAGLMLLLGCNQKQEVTSMLENEETRTEIFSSISDNPEYLKSFRNYMQVHHGNSQMIMDGSMKGMNRRGGMMNMKDSTAMMQSFMNNPQMMSNMIQMMHTKGMMNDDCMKQAMSHMDENMPEKK
ncbi:hypothetical protein G3I01_13455 [Gramella sp. MT6]|uniref:hypothetical protein n=1 Tax=Gramella sp. MT6 TaxID=2705471 RepID=UPI001C5D04F7|nr:hypothetical protein [Gramella sp. MT6]QYA26463.1 hypothetical protein G3I01_13455 [Gramella sp. MT6]